MAMEGSVSEIVRAREDRRRRPPPSGLALPSAALAALNEGRPRVNHRADPLVTGELERLDDADAVEQRRAAAGDDALFDRRACRVERVLASRRGAQR
jgi:hypothetical protein